MDEVECLKSMFPSHLFNNCSNLILKRLKFGWQQTLQDQLLLE